MTMGTVLAACLAARIAVGEVATRTSTLSAKSSAMKAWYKVRVSLGCSDIRPGYFSLRHNRDRVALVGMPVPDWPWIVGEVCQIDGH